MDNQPTLCCNNIDKTANLIVKLLNHLNDNQEFIDSDGDLLEYVKNYLLNIKD